MGIINEMLDNIMLKLYFLFVGSEEISKQDGESIEIKTTFRDVTYVCHCKELIFTVKPSRRFARSRTNRTYEVTMRNTVTDNITTGTYPVMCPSGFIYTNYPHMLAIRCHYHLYHR